MEIFQIISENQAETIGVFTTIQKAQELIEGFAEENNLIIDGYLNNDIYLWYDEKKEEAYDILYMVTHQLDPEELLYEFN